MGPGSALSHSRSRRHLRCHRSATAQSVRDPGQTHRATFSLAKRTRGEINWHDLESGDSGRIKKICVENYQRTLSQTARLV
jgi:hypothetical protein